MASIDKQASRIARALFAVAPIIPPLPRGFIRNQNQALSRLQITKSTPKWRLRLDETTLTARTSSIHLRTPSSRFRETRRVLDTYRSEFAAAQRWVTYGILKRGPSPHFREMYDSAVVFLYDGQTSRAPFGASGPSDSGKDSRRFNFNSRLGNLPQESLQHRLFSLTPAHISKDIS
jgi:hypothetical protein